MGFIVILILVTLAIAGSAAFFSVYGLAAIFSGSFWPVVIMASSLEAGKLVAASYVYRYWDHISFTLKSYLMGAILVLMFITSIGIFGFLSAAYQKDILPLAEMETKIELFDQKIADLEKIRSEDQLQLQRLQDDKSKEIAALPANYASKKAEVAKRYADRIAKVEENIASYTLQIRATSEEKQELKLSTLQQEIKTGPIIFIAEAFGREVNDATKWLILIIIFAFDPLAVALTVGANIALVERQTHRRRRKDDRVEMSELVIHTEQPDDTSTVVEPNDDVRSKEEQTQPVVEIPVVQGATVDQIEEALEEFYNQQRDLSQIEMMQKSMLEEMLRKRKLTERIRNPNAK